MVNNNNNINNFNGVNNRLCKYARDKADNDKKYFDVMLVKLLYNLTAVYCNAVYLFIDRYGELRRRRRRSSRRW
jgi:hypothetical protein